jgi:hypothetical protein
MQIIIFLDQDDRFYLSTNSCLNHRHHPALKADAILRGHTDMEQGDLDLLSLLFSVNAGVQISQIMQSLKGPEAGTYLPEKIYNMTSREGLRHVAIINYVVKRMVLVQIEYNFVLTLSWCRDISKKGGNAPWATD